jgi:protein involved in polysaccharide export with SLBB domain
VLGEVEIVAPVLQRFIRSSNSELRYQAALALALAQIDSSTETDSQALSQAGGLNSIAQSHRVRLTRKTQQGSKTVVVDVDAINAGDAEDIPLQAGDRLFVEERVF